MLVRFDSHLALDNAVIHGSEHLHGSSVMYLTPSIHFHFYLDLHQLYHLLWLPESSTSHTTTRRATMQTHRWSV